MLPNLYFIILYCRCCNSLVSFSEKALLVENGTNEVLLKLDVGNSAFATSVLNMPTGVLHIIRGRESTIGNSCVDA